MNLLALSDKAAFYICVIAGSAGAAAGFINEPLIAGVAGAIAAIAPIVNRIASSHDIARLGPRSLSVKQRQKLIETLRAGSTFKLWVAHNRLEAEPADYHRQINEALAEAGLETQYYGGMNNLTLGIEISGQPPPQKTLLMAAFTAAKIPYTNVVFQDAPDPLMGFGMTGVWIGSNPGLGK